MDVERTALILIDIQNIYFTPGDYLLDEPERAAAQASRLLSGFRELGLPVFHIRHLFGEDDAPGVEQLRAHHESVAALPKEPVIDKRHPSAFLETDLRRQLENMGVQRLVVAGMMSHMCVDTTVRAAQDFGYDVLLVDDACTTKPLQTRMGLIGAAVVHEVFMASLDGTFASVLKTDACLALLRQEKSK